MSYKHKKLDYIAEPCTDSTDTTHIIKKDGRYVGEAYEEFFQNSGDWEKVVDCPVGTKVLDTYSGITYTKQSDGFWTVPSMSIPFSISDKEIKGGRFKLVEDENPWKISQFKGSYTHMAYLHSDGYYYLDADGEKEVQFKDLINSNKGWKIQAVSNGKEEFSVGEAVKIASHTGTIKYFSSGDYLVIGLDNGMTWRLVECENVEKVPVLYTTEDGVKRFEYHKHSEHWVCKHTGDDFYTYLYTLRPIAGHWTGGTLETSQYKIFSTKEAALKFIEDSKPKVLYTTEDGVPRYKAENEWWIYNNKDWYFCSDKFGDVNPEYHLVNGKIKENWKVFSTEKAAEQFIEENNKKYSLKDVRKALSAVMPMSADIILDSFIKELKNGKN